MGILPDPGQDLAHVLWIGGSPCSGKSSIAKILAQRHELQVYHVDEAFNERHRSRLNPTQHSTLHKWHTSPWDELWMQPQEHLLREAIAAYGEHFGMILEDLRSMPRSVTILAEGTALLPDLVSSLPPERRRVLWIVPSEEFQRSHYPNRGQWVQAILNQCGDPEQALQNWMDRDVAFAKWVAERTKDLGMALLQVDGTDSIAETAAWVGRHFRFE